MYVGLPSEITVNIKHKRFAKFFWFTWIPSTLMFIVVSFGFCIELKIIMNSVLTISRSYAEKVTLVLPQ